MLFITCCRSKVLKYTLSCVAKSCVTNLYHCYILYRHLLRFSILRTQQYYFKNPRIQKKIPNINYVFQSVRMPNVFFNLILILFLVISVLLFLSLAAESKQYFFGFKGFRILQMTGIIRKHKVTRLYLTNENTICVHNDQPTYSQSPNQLRQILQCTQRQTWRTRFKGWIHIICKNLQRLF